MASVFLLVIIFLLVAVFPLLLILPLPGVFNIILTINA
jgi:hypothetical protein